MSEQKPTQIRSDTDPVKHAMRGLSVQELIEGGARLVLTPEQIEAFGGAVVELDREDQPYPVDKAKKVGGGIVRRTLHNPLERAVMDTDQSDVNQEVDNIRALYEEIEAVTDSYSAVSFEDKIPLAKFNKRKLLGGELVRKSTPGSVWEIEKRRGTLETRNRFQLYYLPGDESNTLDKVEFSVLDKADENQYSQRRLEKNRSKQNMLLKYGPNGKISKIETTDLSKYNDFFKAVTQEPESSEAMIKLSEYLKKAWSPLITIELNGDKPSITHSKQRDPYLRSGGFVEEYRFEYDPKKNMFTRIGDVGQPTEITVDEFVGVIDGLLKFIPTDIEEIPVAEHELPSQHS